jgi:hypothetical protein
VLVCHAQEKGTFQNWYVELEDEEFDETKLTYSQIQTIMGTFIDKVWYAGKELETEWDEYCTEGKDFDAALDYINPKAYHDNT